MSFNILPLLTTCPVRGSYVLPSCPTTLPAKSIVPVVFPKPNSVNPGIIKLNTPRRGLTGL